ncbi:hypothetical protein A3736_08650 [Erythrobacter sp. HI0063]|jgi:hypothetical protein|nr:hypothetical protein A3736_08650 [Erythrobacter sp. HI0063]
MGVTRQNPVKATLNSCDPIRPAQGMNESSAQQIIGIALATSRISGCPFFEITRVTEPRFEFACFGRSGVEGR